MTQTIHTRAELNALFDRGYEDRKAGWPVPAEFALDMGSKARAYRDGERARRRDEEIGAMMDPGSIGPVLTALAGAEIREGDLVAVTSTNPLTVEPVGLTAYEIEAREQTARLKAMRADLAKAVGFPESRLYGEPRDPLTQAADSSALHGFDPPAKGKRAKKPKPVDESQADLFL